ncbi:MAG TPA: hypothetical protein VFH58_05550, partial [Acidimicrobiales bacterium]|nr:hypothetical protein [Acidimicrobiales bacterium]
GAAAPAALVSDEVVPWRPNRGIYLVVEDSGADHPYDDRSYDDHPNDALLGLPGVAGVWRFATAERYRRWQATAGDYRMTVVYLDGDPAQTAGPVGEAIIAGRPGGTEGLLLAAPFEALAPWAWQPLSAVLPDV